MSKLQVTLTITTADERIRKIFEPNAPSISQRIKTLEKLHQEGIKTCVMIAPLLPKAENLVFQLKGKADKVIIDEMNYHYADWVYKKYQLGKRPEAGKILKRFQEEGIVC
jgi:DNA repair photolyase